MIYIYIYVYIHIYVKKSIKDAATCLWHLLWKLTLAMLFQLLLKLTLALALAWEADTCLAICLVMQNPSHHPKRIPMWAAQVLTLQPWSSAVRFGLGEHPKGDVLWKAPRVCHFVVKLNLYVVSPSAPASSARFRNVIGFVLLVTGMFRVNRHCLVLQRYF